MNTPQETIELVKKWLDDPESVSKEELRNAANIAHDSFAAIYSGFGWGLACAAAKAACSDDGYSNTKHWVNEYERLSQKEG